MKRRVIYVRIAEHCNLACLHCFTNGDEAPKRFLDLADAVRWVGELHRYDAGQGKYSLSLQGGEPLLGKLEDITQFIRGVRAIAPDCTIGMTSNLTFKNAKPRLDWLIESINNGDLDGLATSWDPGIRFRDINEELLWRTSVEYLQKHDVYPTLNISISKPLLRLEPEVVLEFIETRGFRVVTFEPISSNGSGANDALGVFPTNRERDHWRLRMHDAIVDGGYREKITLVDFEEIYRKFEDGQMNSGTYCRGCESMMLTLNADGSIGTCPNTALDESIGDVKDAISDLLGGPRIKSKQQHERRVHTGCITCPVYQYCGGGCHILNWDESGCPQPKLLMQALEQTI